MAEIIMPKMGDAMTEGKVIRWYKKAGDAVRKGEPVLEIETDKVNLDLEAEEDGVLEEITVAEGVMAPVGGHLANIGAGGDASAKKPAEEKPAEAKSAEAKPAEAKSADTKPAEAKPAEAEPAETKPASGKQAPAEAAEPGGQKEDEGEPVEAKPAAGKPAAGGPKETKLKPVPPPPADDEDESVPAGEDSSPALSKPRPVESGERRRSSPLARRMARDLGVAIEAVEGSGPGGRIVASDVKRMQGSAAGPQATPATPQSAAPAAKREPQSLAQALTDETVPLTAMRRTIARRLSESTGPIPHFYLTADYDVTALLALREQLGEIAGARPSVNDFIVRAAALALHHHPYVNASFTAEAIQLHGQVHIGIAVSTPEGLLTPVVRDADQKGVTDIAADVRSLAEKARNHKLKPDEYQGSTFTISNLGAWGIEEFTAIINPPNVAILAVGAAGPRAVVIDRQIVIRDRMNVTLSCDHRVVDGALGSEYLKTLRQYIEQPLRLVL
jgi:pyruvate dehydrogenase E2 component (dihydrolipoamide acetyltransferase)